MYQFEVQDLTINKVRLFSQYNDHKRNYKPVNDMFFTHFESGYLTSYNILLKFMNYLLCSYGGKISEVAPTVILTIY